MALNSVDICFCIKLPEGFTQNRYGEKFVVGNKYLYDFYDESKEGLISYRIFESIWGEPMLIRDEIWFEEHFATPDRMREIKINNILSED
jgi:hypothetical protein